MLNLWNILLFYNIIDYLWQLVFFLFLVSSVDKSHFYRNHLVLENPVASCEVKVRKAGSNMQALITNTNWSLSAENQCGVSVQLLSLGGRSSVAIAHVGVGLEMLKDRQGGPSIDPGIDLQRVQTMMEEMGTTLSPGAQNLMELVQYQQKVWIQLLIIAESPIQCFRLFNVILYSLHNLPV